ncbi:survival motor neuron protein-like [Saccostrea echinata]|uniref:survival motor neuron protein-like n=1 Tax=Saccostrea echinata TaxID=191078 RepID=UPI002A7F9265|nr:survival motor neuron protein-like [Saccostrea echinata]
MASTGTVLFHRGRPGSDSENDLWDDTALIKAYDNAISIVKAHINNEQGLTDEEKPVITDKKRRGGKRKKRHRKKKQWKPGDQCRAIFSEDGLVYDAEILSVDQSTRTCIVRYRGYGNEEEQILDNLRSAPGRRSQQQKLSAGEAGSLADSMDWCGQRSDASSKDPNITHGSKHHHHKSAQSGGSPWPGVPPVPTFPVHNIPFVPPPPPLIAEDPLDGDNEVMCSMLMAWYMSGYHTGYYQGMKHARQQDHRGTSPCSDSVR